MPLPFGSGNKSLLASFGIGTVPSRIGAVLGDSVSAQAFGGSIAAGLSMSTVGYATWLNYLSRRRVDISHAGNFGVAGETSTQILARVGAVVDYEPGFCIVMAGTNDISSIAAATTIANLNAIYDALAAAQITVIAIPIAPRGSLTTNQYGRIHQVNRWIYSQRGVRKAFRVVDVSAAYGDPLTGAPRLTMSGDELHPNTLGAFAIANELLPVITSLYPDPMLPFSNPLDLYSAADNPTGNLLPSGVGLMVGTAGTLSNGPTGSLATGWSANGVNLPAGVTTAFAKVSKADGRNMVQLTLGGTYNSAAPGSLNISTASVHGNVAAGDTVELMGDLEVDAGMAGVAAIQLVLNVTTTGGNPTPIDMLGNSAFVMPGLAHNGIPKTPPVTMPATPSVVSVSLRITPTAVGVSSPISGVIRFGSFSLRKLI